MDVRIIDNKRVYLDEVLREALSWADEVNIAVAYGKYSAFEQFSSEFSTLMERNGKLRVLLDIEKIITDPQLIEEFATIPGDSRCKIYYKPGANRPQGEPVRMNYHPKLYLFKSLGRVTAIVGSANFTPTGIRGNVEIGLELKGDQEQDIPLKGLCSVFSDIWNEWYALDVIDNADLVSAYRRVFERGQQEERRRRKATKDLLAELEREAAAALVKAQASLNKEVAYMWGLACGAGTVNRTRREVSLRIHGTPLNTRDSRNRGYVFVQGVSRIRIPQDEALKRDSENITEQLNSLFSRSASGDTATCRRRGEMKYVVTVIFSKDSPYWSEILRMAKEVPDDNVKECPIIPERILNADKSLKKAFVRGYFDVRSRLSRGDSFPDGKLRVALGVGTRAEGFGQELKGILRDDFNVQSARFASGKRRGRDNLLRMNPREISPGMLSSHWKRLLLKDFQRYNKEHFPSYAPADQKKTSPLL